MSHKQRALPLRTPRMCRFCGCTEERACALEDWLGDIEPCSWLAVGVDVCTNPKCVALYRTVESQNAARARARLRGK